MSSTKHDDSRSPRRWFKPEQAPASRRGREHWTVRWIGAAKRRASKSVDGRAIKAPSTCIIQLSWADTFGRPVRIAATEIFQPSGTIVRLLPH